ncbi:MAG: hypothetical protein Satyrvirus19_3 [Satyrvirus sp.]|uniref:Uncharacterized protein n=1 Tax=Satyrvirus sp. TaxID=2487771 RepID=A0A3G5AGQ4_9VIRU|nr:MAG: hypothetical protein Satyrvirus19_3 [Satyrvirus sp.]
MYGNIANKNPIITQFNSYMVQNPNIIPFRNNELINNNVHVINNLNNLVHQNRIVQQRMKNVQPNENKPSQLICEKNGKNESNENIIAKMLKPQKIVKDNSDIPSNYQVRKNIQEKAKKGEINIKMTNTPYKNIIKDRIITKNVNEITKDDLVVHKSVKEIDANIEKFEKELNIKENEKEKINDELKIEFHIDNYDSHKRNFSYKETFIRNLTFEQNTYNETKQDYIDFYRQKQKEAEEGQKLCDEILHNYNIDDEGIISKDELPATKDSIISGN